MNLHYMFAPFPFWKSYPERYCNFNAQAWQKTWFSKLLGRLRTLFTNNPLDTTSGFFSFSCLPTLPSLSNKEPSPLNQNTSISPIYSIGVPLFSFLLSLHHHIYCTFRNFCYPLSLRCLRVPHVVWVMAPRGSFLVHYVFSLMVHHLRSRLFV